MSAVGSSSQSQAGSTRIVFLGAPFDLIPLANVLETLRRRAAGDAFRYVVTPNVDHINRLAAHPGDLPLYHGAWQCWCDSTIIQRVGRLFDRRLPHLNGTDVMVRLFADILRPGDRIAVIAARPEILTALRCRFPHLAIEGHCPPMGFVTMPAAFEACVDFAAACGARFLFVAVGAPQSERLCHRIAAQPGATGTAFCIGAAMEFIGGLKTRAPSPFRTLGLEWLHRLLSEPRRLWRRYILGIVPFARLVWREARGDIVAPAPPPCARTRPLILHISADYPDPIRKPATRAVEHLVDRLGAFDQVVISLFRLSDPRQVYWRDLGTVGGRRLVAHGYFAPPLGVGMLFFQHRLSRHITRFLVAEGLRPDVVHGHRFTFEGIASWFVARRYGAALFLSVRGEVERKVMRAKPTYRLLWRRMAADAARILYVSAWFQPEMRRLTAAHGEKSRLFPNIVVNTRPVIEPRTPDARFCTVLDLDVLKRKNLPGLLDGVTKTGQALDGLILEVIGGGTIASERKAAHMVRDKGLVGRVALVGRLAHPALMEALGRALFLALPSFDETFGMVFTEALFVGTPILYARDSGIDGYLDGLAVGEAVDPNDPDDIARGLVRLARDNHLYRRAIQDSAGELFRRFDPDRVIAAYARDVAAVSRPRPFATDVRAS